MESAGTQTITRPTELNSFPGSTSDDRPTQKRLDTLLAVNLEIAREKMLFHSEKERMRVASMKNPMSDKQAFAYFGLLLGIFPPAAIFARFFMNAGNFRGEDFWILGVVAVVNLITAVVGYFSGKVVGKLVGELERLSWSKMLLVLPFIGFLWGALAGGAGGIIIFLIGAIAGAIFGATVGSLALPVFAIFHRLMKYGDKLEQNHFLPLSFGITFIVCAFILGW
jgi:hypothetical protein